MPLTDIIRRASIYILGSEGDSPKSLHENNEILFCKNNVCVHPPAALRQDTDVLHHPGYITITTKIFVDQYNETQRPTLFLTWIPNTVLTKCPSALQNNLSNFKSSMESLASNDSSSSSLEERLTKNVSERPASIELSRNTNPFLSNYDDSLSSEDSYKQTTININVDIANPEIEIVTTPERDHKFEICRSESVTSNDSSASTNHWLSTPEFLVQKHNLMFPESTNCSPVLPTKRQHKCRRFSVDLSQMRSLRLFFNDNNCTCGQLVVASRESQYKILHFHHGGLDHLAQVLHQWHSILHKDTKSKYIIVAT